MKWIIPAAAGFTPHKSFVFLWLFALILTAAMALKSDYNRHPDEVHHFLAARYYTNHFFPPEIGDPAVRDSYSAYGVSYLNYHWAEYFYAGKFMFLLSPVISNPLAAARFSSVFLFFCLVVLFLRRAGEDNRELIIPSFLLVTPQIWYVFSYINNDVFALSVSLVMAYQIAYQKSFWNEFLRAENFTSNLTSGILFGCLTGFLLIAKSNYYSFLLFVALWLWYSFPALKINFANRTFGFSADYRLLKKYVFVSLVAFLVLTFRVGLDFHVNGETNFVGVSYLGKYLGNLENEGKLLAYQNEIAEPSFRPSTVENDLMNTESGLKLKAKGYSFKRLFSERKWHEFSFASFVGGYAYMDLWASKNFYRLFAILYIAFGAYLIFVIIRSRRAESITQLAIFLFASTTTVAVSIALSWIYAFQPQGRYLFPIIGMLGLLVHTNRQLFHNAVLYAFIIAAFALSVYSFVFVALPNINLE